MTEITLLSNKTRRALYKYFFIVVFAVITWVLQLSVFNRLSFFDTSPNFMLIGSIYFGLACGPLEGTLFGTISSFFSASILYDHVFYFSYPIFGLLAGLLTKNLFADELLFFILFSFVVSFPFELLNGWQYSSSNQGDVLTRFFNVALYSSVVNLISATFFYFIMKLVTKKLNLRQENYS